MLGASLAGVLQAAPIPERTKRVVADARVASPAESPAATAVPIGWWTFLALPSTLSLPPDARDVDLAAIPDRILNDPPAARLRVPLEIRGTSGLGSVDEPAEISWTEAGYWYWMRSSVLTIPQLVELASALR